MARRKGQRTSTLALVGWAILMLSLGLALGVVLGQQACNRGERPAKHDLPRSEPKASEPRIPEKKRAEPKSKAPSGASKSEGKPLPPTSTHALPRMALIIDDLGYVQPELVTRLCSLPIPFSVAVLPYQEYSRESAEIAHRLGKEVMLHLPMEPLGYPGPGHDPGPHAILYSLSESEVRRRVRQALDEIPHRSGVNNHMGSRITPDRTRMGWVLQEIKARNCFFVDSRTEKESVAYEVAESLAIPAAQRRVFLDDDKAFPEMEKQWERAIRLAEKDGSTIIIGHIYPETVEALEKLIARSKGQVRMVTAGQVAR